MTEGGKTGGKGGRRATGSVAEGRRAESGAGARRGQSRAEDHARDRERVTLLVGRHAVARQGRLRELVDRWVDPEWQTFNYSEIEARDLSPGDLLMALAQVPVGDPGRHRVVVVRAADRLRAGEAEALAAILPRVPNEARLILAAEGDRTGRDARLSARLLRAVEAEGQVFDFPPLRPADAPAFIAGCARQMGLRLAPDVPRLLAARVGPDSGTLERELEKLRAAAPDGTVTADLVTSLVSPSAEHTVFELTDAVGERSAARALAAMQGLLASGQNVYLLLPMIARQLRLVWQVKAEMERIEGAALKDPGLARLGDWQRQKLQRQARAFTWPALEEGMAALFHMDLALKGIEEGGEDPQALLEALLLRLCGGPDRAPHRLVEPLHQA